ncbi:MAG TPA: 2-amino-4-hydroxy-6-hydroxymethyldihydropteridine diphosphokinase [Acidimicrobiales bacterium]|nr:2-amino-4-hydroxy-6-hydroxymethyldihydropteridine diphosphokinase [Acidimicrobiales bacterium]
MPDPGSTVTTARGRDLLVHLGLGSNLGDRWSHLGRAVDRLRRVDVALAVSPVYETSPIGGPEGQGPYLNCVVRLRVDGSARDVLALVAELESMEGRVRTERWGPRTLDVDVLLLGGIRVDEEDLVVPHPRMAERAFVLAPLEDLDPGLVPDGWRERLGGDGAVAAAVRRVGDLVLVEAP